MWKQFQLKKQGIQSNILGKGDKPKNATALENILKNVTYSGAVIQFGRFTLVLIADIVFIAAIIEMKNNWRAGFSSDQGTNLVTSGIYQRSRNPAFLGFDLLYIGCSLAYLNFLNLVITVVAVILFHLQIQGEEQFLTDTFKEEYADYKIQVRRYI
ncbi:MAG: putative isoprenylcysteine carboxylmethyltransferase family protein [Streblomastix strix]|uniref:Putative isoprenylcysteine carboxylmethyltransferase family protein n=1 Tax=Streblomastix strix TaxID=222440 RepID=A0A5J4W0Z8_9EUKA|nr:MAG: putative isoprenylcysteine carboxylmethyltransferase family protein [Streblomastix strix]